MDTGPEHATERIAELRASLRRTLDQAGAMLDAEATTANEWAETSTQLRDACWRLAAATYIINEWTEPDDAQPDIASHAQRYRRNIHAWDES